MGLYGCYCAPENSPSSAVLLDTAPVGHPQNIRENWGGGVFDCHRFGGGAVRARNNASATTQRTARQNKKLPV